MCLQVSRVAIFNVSQGKKFPKEFQFVSICCVVWTKSGKKNKFCFEFCGIGKRKDSPRKQILLFTVSRCQSKFVPFLVIYMESEKKGSKFAHYLCTDSVVLAFYVQPPVILAQGLPVRLPRILLIATAQLN